MNQAPTSLQPINRKTPKMIPIFIRISAATNKRLRRATGRRKGQTDVRTFIENAVVEKLDRDSEVAA